MGRRRKDRELHWRGVFDRQSASGLNVAGFCRQESISAPSFYAWRRKLKERAAADDSDAITTVSSGQLLPVRIESSAPPTPVRILLPQGVAIDASSSIDPSVLADLLRTLREATVC